MTRKMCRYFVLVTLVFSVFLSPAQAQDMSSTWLSVKTGPAAILLNPSSASIVVKTVAVGTRVQAQKLENGWYLVIVPRTENERAPVSGWLPATMVSAAVAPAASVEQLQSPATAAGVTESTSGTAASGAVSDLRSQRAKVASAIRALDGVADDQVLRARLVKLDAAIRATDALTTAEPTVAAPFNSTPTAAQAPPQTPPAPRVVPAADVPFHANSGVGDRGWVDVNIGGAQSGAGATAFAFSAIQDAEILTLASAYPKPSRGADFDFGGGYMFTPRFGLGLSFTGTAHSDFAGLGAEVPHPFFFDASATAANITDTKLVRAESGAHIQAMMVAVHTNNVRLRLFGGPSYFRYKADMVQDIAYTQIAPRFSAVNVVDITGFQATTVEGTGWGLHVGSDVSYFFSRIFGVGGFGRYSRGTVSVAEPMSEETQTVTVGGLQFGGGLRLRF